MILHVNLTIVWMYNQVCCIEFYYSHLNYL